MSIGPASSPDFAVRTALRKAAWDNGFRIEGDLVGPWQTYRSTTAAGQVWLAGSSARGPWWLATDHPGVMAEFGEGELTEGAGLAAYGFADQRQLYQGLDRVYRLGVSLLSAPLNEFENEIAGLPRSTEVERLAVQRIGQDVFRRALMQYWEGRCAVTGLSDPALLKASHIVPWAECVSDAQRLDVNNGLLLSALWDAAFDAGLVSFDDDGAALISHQLSLEAEQMLGLASRLRRKPSGEQRNFLQQHRRRWRPPKALEL